MCIRLHRVLPTLSGALVVLMVATVSGQDPEPAPDLEPMLEMVPISPGAFTMGSPTTESGRRDDETRHRVTLTRQFYIGAREVTQYLWQEIMGYDRSYQAGCAECPVENVTWYEAVEFCNRLSGRLGLEATYEIAGTDVIWRADVVGIRLPTEAEWEYVYRAGTETPFPAGDCLTADQANLNGYLPWGDCPESLWRGQTIPVGGLPAGAWGVFDLGGNVAEWCWDRYAPHGAAPATDPVGPATGEIRVQRGGAFNAGMIHARSAARLGVPAGVRAAYRGLRIALTPPPDAGAGP